MGLMYGCVNIVVSQSHSSSIPYGVGGRHTAPCRGLPRKEV
jgi:hypothetical protein